MQERYPKIAIQSKNDLAKRISHKNLSYDQAMCLINDVLINKDNYWKDAPEPLSEPTKGKYVRNAKRTPLGDLLKLIDRQVLRPYDQMIPSFIFGGIKGRGHALAAANLIGQKKYRSLLKCDLQRFYEHVPKHRVISFLMNKAGCSRKGARILAQLCCVHLGEKGNDSTMSIARGFATSARLAVWCNLGFFIKINRLVQRELKGHDPRISIYVDDIGVTASRVTEEQMNKLYLKIKEILHSSNVAYQLPLNEKKTKIVNHQQGLRQLGTIIGRNSLSISDKTSAKIYQLKKKMTKASSQAQRTKFKKKRGQLMAYKKYIEGHKV